MNSTGLQPLSRLLWACTLPMLFLNAVGILGSARLDSLVERPVISITSLVPLELSHGLASAILSATIAVVFYAVVTWIVLTAWNRLLSR